MIQQLLLLFKTYPDNYCTLSKTGKRNNCIVSNLSFYYSNKVIMVFSILWIIYHLFYYNKYLQLRPHELFTQRVWFGEFFLPSFPSASLYYIISFIGIVLIVVLLFYKDKWFIRAIVAFIILWLNLVRWSCGGESLSSHLFMFAHIFAIFIPVVKIKEENDNEIIDKALIYYYIGILTPYFFSGFWKILALVNAFVFKPNDISWLSSKAGLYTSLIAYHLTDLSSDYVLFLFTYPLFWQISFLFTCFVLETSVMAAFRQPLRIWVGIALIVFHQVNNIAFDVMHYVSSIILFCLFFPYDKIFPISQSYIPVSRTNFEGKNGKAFYERIYSNGDRDTFLGFYAYREKITDRNRILGGLLFFPFLDAFISFIWKKKYKSQ